MFSFRTLLVGSAALAFLAAPAMAQQTFFGEDLFGFSTSSSISSRSFSFPNASNAESLFLSALTSDVGTEDFESGFTHKQSAPIGLSFPGAGTATLSGSGRIQQYSADCPDGFGAINNWCGNDRYPTSGDWFFDTPAGSDFDVTFDNPVAAFGFYGVDIGDVGGQLTLEFLDVNDVVTNSWLVPHTVGSGENTTGGVIYAGFVDEANPFKTVRFRNNSGGDLFAFDDMTIASTEQVVPEPATMILLASGLLGVGLVARRRRGDD